MFLKFHNLLKGFFFLFEHFYRITSNQADMPIFNFLWWTYFSHILLYCLYWRINGCRELHKKVLHTLEYKFVTSSECIFLIRRILLTWLGLKKKMRCKLFTPHHKVYEKRAHLRIHFLFRYHISINYMQRKFTYFSF